MDSKKKRRWLILASVGVVLLLLGALFLFKPFHLTEKANTTASSSSSAAPATYVPGSYPEGMSFADVEISEGLSDRERFNAYDHDNDPAHPVLDVKVMLSISSLGSRPGTPRPQDIAHEYPPQSTSGVPTPTTVPTPSATIKPGVVNPGIKPGVTLPKVELPELYIIEPDIASPKFTGERYTLSWEYTAGRKVVFAVSLSVDDGTSFKELATGLADKKYELTFPGEPSNHCILRVTAMLDGRVYKTADSNDFTLVVPSVPAPALIKDYVDPQVRYVNQHGVRISSASDLPVWFKADSAAKNADKLIWQLSKIPFWGTKQSFGSEPGIIASGSVDMKQNGEFPVDLKALCEELTKPKPAGSAGKPFLTKQNIYAFYIRVVALDKNGNCIGDPGRGLSFSYGAPDVVADLNSTSFAEHSQIGVLIYMPYDYKWQWKRVSPGVLNRGRELAARSGGVWRS